MFSKTEHTTVEKPRACTVQTCSFPVLTCLAYTTVTLKSMNLDAGHILKNGLQRLRGNPSCPLDVAAVHSGCPTAWSCLCFSEAHNVFVFWKHVCSSFMISNTYFVVILCWFYNSTVSYLYFVLYLYSLNCKYQQKETCSIPSPA